MIRPVVMDLRKQQRITINGHHARVLAIRPMSLLIQWEANGQQMWLPKFGHNLSIELAGCCPHCSPEGGMKVC